MVVYKITNNVNGKLYIGITVRTLHKRWVQHQSDARKGSNSPLHKAMRKHGVDNFIPEVICEVTTEEELKQREIELIDLFETYGSGYNATRGGDGTFGKTHSTETRERIREGLRKARMEGRFLNDDWLVNCRAARAKQTGVPLSDQHRSNISSSLKGRAKNPNAGKQPIGVDQLTIDGDHITTHESYAAAATAVQSNSSDIMRACQGKRKTVKGYVFNWAKNNTKKDE